MKHSYILLAAVLAFFSLGAKAQNGTPVTSTPDGDAFDYLRSAYGVTMSGYKLVWSNASDIPTTVVMGETTDKGQVVWMNNINFGAPWAKYAYIKGYMNNGVLEFQLPQLIEIETTPNATTGELLYYYYNAQMMKWNGAYDAYGDKQMIVDTDDNVLRFKVENNVYTQIQANGEPYPATDEKGLGITVTYNDGKNTDWRYSLESQIVLSPSNLETTTLPAGAEVLDYEMIAGTTTTSVKAAIVGNDYYIANFCKYAPADSWVKGTLGSDNKVTFTGGQYMGDNPDYGQSCFFTPLKRNYINENDYDLEVADELVFTLDPETNNLSTDGDFAVNTSRIYVRFYELFQEPVIRPKRTTIESYVPKAPTSLTYVAEDPTFGTPTLIFYLPPVSIKEDILPTNQLYWLLYVDNDDEPWEFLQLEYSNLPNDMVDVPYDFSDNYDIIADGARHKLFLKFADQDRLGVQTLCVNGVDTYYSEITWLDTSSVKNLTGEPVSVEYYNLDGMRVKNPGKGLYIIKTTDSEGRVKASKSVIR